MKIEIWSDFACPFCYIGKRRLEGALQAFPQRDKVEVVYRSFELDPSMARDVGMDMYEILANKYGGGREQAKGMCDNMAEQAKTVGLDFRFDTLIPTNTFDAHRLSHLAAAHGKMGEMTERLLHAYFTESKHLGDHAVLADLAAEAGLDREEAVAVLAGDAYSDEVHADEDFGQQLGIRGVPFFVFNQKYAVSGAQPTEVFAEVLQKVWQEEQPLQVLSEGAVCTDDSCDFPAK
ncbi:DsbA family oxidoreductase [Ectobacillus ponti]|uniref:DsbA family oxidoreductase n=1 Tax=Ectobacillus ponti TaxID=2961894 RepID=A0AA41XB48_9BACI|nr:DsbA family oxidoreductase [Ectobacillus ponti]MCP8969623.1 DsbA family oxidoreductase [Ectobacillus ponti]